MGDWQFEENLRPKRNCSSNCQSPVLCLSPCCRIREYSPRFLSGRAHLLISRCIPLLFAAHAGFSLVGSRSISPLCVCGGCPRYTPWEEGFVNKNIPSLVPVERTSVQIDPWRSTSLPALRLCYGPRLCDKNFSLALVCRSGLEETNEKHVSLSR